MLVIALLVVAAVLAALAAVGVRAPRGDLFAASFFVFLLAELLIAAHVGT